ncbi:MAG TPA: DUF4019 domain-containing protein [Salinibacter sp.]|nr:DUF4019 domain-containing protein [Salinibacter sp.]
MHRFVPFVFLFLLLIGGSPVHAQEADSSAADTTAMEAGSTDVVPEPRAADTSEALAPAVADSADAGERATTARSPEARAKAAAESWLSRIDAGEFEESWDLAAPSLREGLSREQWIERGTRVRRQLQSLQSRTLQSSQYRDSTAQDVGDGPVAILQYVAEFDGGTTLEAVITTRRDSTWSVAGYRVVPAPATVTVPDSTKAPSDSTEATPE